MDDQDRTDSTHRRCPSRDKKRKSRSDEDTSSRESSQLEPIKTGRKQKRNKVDEPGGSKKFGFKCAPLLLFEFLKQLSPDQIIWLDDIGFGALRLMPEARLPRDLSLWLIDQVDTQRKALVVDGSAIDIRKCIRRLLNIPNGDLPVPAPRGTSSKIRSTTGEEKELKDADSGRGNSCGNFIAKVLALSEPVKFKRWCMFVILCLYLAPASGLVINRNYMTTLANMDVISQMDWCTFVVDYLIEGVTDSRRSTATNVMVHGCIHILLLIYASIVKSRVIHIPKEGFVADHVTTIMLEQLQSIDKKISENEGITFGLLEVDKSVFEDCICPTEAQTITAVHPKSNIPRSCNLNSQKIRGTQSSPGLPESSRASNPSESSTLSQDDIDKIESAYHREKYAIYRKSNKALNISLKKLEARRKQELDNLRLKSSQSLEHSPELMAVDTNKVDSGGRYEFASVPIGSVYTGDANEPDGTITHQSAMPTVAAGEETVISDLPTEVLCNEPLPENIIDDCPHENQHVVQNREIFGDKSQSEIHAARMVDSIVQKADELYVTAEITHDPVDRMVESGNVCNKTVQVESMSEVGFGQQSSAILGGSFKGQSSVDNSTKEIVAENLTASTSCGKPSPSSIDCGAVQGFTIESLQHTECLVDSGAILSTVHIEGTKADQNDSITEGMVSHSVPMVSEYKAYSDNNGSHGPSMITVRAPQNSENNQHSKSVSYEEQDETKYDNTKSKYTQGVDSGVYRDQHDLDISDYDDMHGVAVIGTESIADLEAFKNHGFCSSLREQTKVANDIEQDQLSLPPHISTPKDANDVQMSHLSKLHDNVCASASSKQISASNISRDEPRGSSSEIARQHNHSSEAADSDQPQDSNGSTEDASGDECDDKSDQDIVSSDEDGTQTDKPVFTRDEVMVNITPDIFEPSTPEATSTVFMLESAIPKGERFRHASCVNSAIKSRIKRHGAADEKIDGIALCIKVTSIPRKIAIKSFKDHVDQSSYRHTKARDPEVRCNDPSAVDKIRIRGARISEEDYVHCLRPGGLVSQSFMWICCLAIMEDWGSRASFVLNQSIIAELMKPVDRCNYDGVCRMLRRTPMKETEQFYIPVVNSAHWILIVISIVGQNVEIYDSLRRYKIDEDPYKDLWNTIGYNFQEAYHRITGNSAKIHNGFSRGMAKIHNQDNDFDCGFEVMRALECHNGRTLIRYGKKSMEVYRSEISHILVYHRFNELNPNLPADHIRCPI